MLKKVLIVIDNKYLSLIQIDSSLIKYQTWETYFIENNNEFNLGKEFNNYILRANENGVYEELEKGHYPYYDSSTNTIKYDEERYQKELKVKQEKQIKEEELRNLNVYFTWYNTQAVQYLSGKLTSEDWQGLQEEYLTKSNRALELKNELGIQTETQIREARLKEKK